MSRLQIRLLGPYFSSFSAHSYGYELSNELKSGLKLPSFRFGPYSPTPSWKTKGPFATWRSDLSAPLAAIVRRMPALVLSAHLLKIGPLDLGRLQGFP
jgi:hypothetical protein